MPQRDFDPTKITAAHRLVGTVVGFSFAATGLILIGWLWLQPLGFMHPPLIFRLMGTMVAIIFVAVGGTAGLAAWRGGGFSAPTNNGSATRSEDSRDRPVSYRCPNCGATLSDDAEASPSGDVKCAYCRTWFNIHRSIGVGR